MSDDHLSRDRDLWRAHDAQYDREVAFRDRVVANERGRRALTQGDTAEAIRSAAGPDAALYYLDAMSGLGDEQEWPPHHYPLDAESLAENMNELQYHMDLRVRVVEDEVRIEAINRYDDGSVVGSCTVEWSIVMDYLARSTELARTEYTRSIVHWLRQELIG